MANKYYNAERARQSKFKKSEEEMDRLYKEELEKEREFEYLNSLHPEDSTREYNPVEHYKNGGIARGCGAVMSNRRKVTKYY
jgi:hypothetical protein